MISLLYLVLSLGYFIYQHFTLFNWDFSVYLMNGLFLIGKHHYFEIFRPPLPGIVFSFLGMLSENKVFLEYGYIIIVFTLYILSCITFARRFNLRKKVFLMLMLNPYALYYGLQCGSELLGLSFVILTISSLNSSKAGIFLALSILSRYNNLIYLPILLFQKRKKAILSIILLCLFLFPWLIFNFYTTGHAFYSFLDGYILNILFRGWEKHRITSIILPFNILLPFFILGLKKGFKDKNILFYPMLGIFVLTILSYLKISIDEPRYLFNLTLPVAYFSYITISNNQFAEKIVKCGLLISLPLLILFTPIQNIESFKKLDLNKECVIMSDYYVILNYLGYKSIPLPLHKKLTSNLISNLSRNYSIVIEKGHTNLNLSKSNFYYKEGFIIINASNCTKKEKIIYRYTKELNKSFGYSENPCIYIFGKKICRRFWWI